MIHQPTDGEERVIASLLTCLSLQITYPSGMTYDGDWQNDVKHGRGIQRFPDGSVYECDFRDDKRNGQGVFRGPDGEIYEVCSLFVLSVSVACLLSICLCASRSPCLYLGHLPRHSSCCKFRADLSTTFAMDLVSIAILVCRPMKANG